MKIIKTLIFTLIALTLSHAVAQDRIQGKEYWVQNGDTKLYLWEKYAGKPSGKPIVVLAHGSATAGKESFDLSVPGKPDMSLMNVLAENGFDVFALDVRGFGRSDHPEKHFTTADASRDLNAVVDYVLKLRNAAKVSLLAWSWATQYGGMFVMANPQKVDRYISYAQMGVDSPDIAKRRQNIHVFRSKVYTQIPEASWHPRFYSMTPKEANYPEAVNTYAKAAVAVEKNTPTSPQLDMVTILPMLNPKLITVPTMIIHGQYDDVCDVAQLTPFFVQLPNPNKRYVQVPDAGHMMMYQKGYKIFQQAVVNYLTEQF